MATEGGARLRTLFEDPSLPRFDLPPALAVAYDGNLRFSRPVLYANFVSSLDGVVSLGEGVPPSVISGKSAADRLVMGLLRACAGAVVVGAGTVRAEPDHLWTPEFIYPALADEYLRLRRDLRLADRPKLVILTNSGRLDPSIRALRQGALVLTTESGAQNLRGALPEQSDLLVLEKTKLDALDVVNSLASQGYQMLLCEGGPSVLGAFLAEELLDELFLTLAPTIAGRDVSTRRPGLVAGFAYDPSALGAAMLLSVKAHRSHLFLRYRLSKALDTSAGS